MRIGLNTSQHHCSWPWLLEVWTRADQIDLFESAWTFDHFHSPTEDTHADCLEGWSKGRNSCQRNAVPATSRRSKYGIITRHYL